MNAFFPHMAKTAIYMAGFYLIYRTLLSKDTMFIRNRFYIILTALAAFILPFVAFETENQIKIPIIGRIFSEILISGDSSVSPQTSDHTSLFYILKWISVIYLTGVVLLSLRLFFDLLELVRLIASKKKSNDNLIFFNNFNTAGFSAFGYIFINEKLSKPEAAEIIRHEQKHLEHLHSFDIIFIEIIRVVQWLNPFIHLYCRSLRTVHEYQADNDCLKTGMPVSNYQELLLNQIFGSKVFTVTNSFSNPTLIKKRMIMMTKKSSCSMANLKLLLVLPVIAGIMVIFSSCKEKNTEINSQEISPSTPIMVDGSAKVVKGEPSPVDMLAPPPPPPPPVPGAEESQVGAPYEKVDVMPQFPGGDQGLVKFIAEHTSYPEGAKITGTQGKVFVKFAVEKDGSIGQISILQGVDPVLDAEALRVVGKLPKFEKPGLIDGKPVAVWYVIPINYKLK